jgi:C-terminal processing protease CtpA/Prc
LQTTLRDGGLDVFFVAPGSPAAEAGWAIGDRIVSVDGAPIGPDWFDERWKWARGEPGTVVRLGLADGTERTLVLRTYYGDAP